MDPHRLVIGFHGAKGAGKNTAADFLTAEIGGTQLAFAKPIKEAAIVLCDFSKEQVYGNREKERMDERYNVTPRFVLQQLGTEFCRNILGEDFFLKRLRAEVERLTGVVLITDVRFSNEAEFIRNELKGMVIHIHRGPAVAAEHASEVPLPPHLVDAHIDNSGTLEELREAVVKLV